MKSSDIRRILELFVESNQRSILLDGPWGCGKTYEVRNFLDNNKKKKTKLYYISLFGKESISEINEELYRQAHPKIIKSRKVIQAISRVVKPFSGISGVDGIIEGIDFAIDNFGDKKISENSIVIFDDLERVDKKLSYISLLGYINSLFLQKTRVIALSSTENIMEVKIEEEFNSFKEKIFDRVHVINEIDQEVIFSYFEKHSIDNLQLIKEDLGMNLRQVQKTAAFFDEVIKYIKEKEYEIEDKTNLLELLKNCNQTLKIYFSNNEQPEIFKQEEDEIAKSLKKAYYDEDVREYGENVTHGIYNLLNKEYKETEDPRLRKYTEKILKALFNIFLYRDFNLLDELFKSITNVSSKTKLLDKNLFYLSDDNKKKYLRLFIDKLHKKELIFDKKTSQRFIDILKYLNPEFSTEEKEKIINSMFSDYDFLNIKTPDVINAFSEELLFAEEPYKIVVEPWEKEIIKQFKLQKLQSIIEKFKENNKLGKHQNNEDLIYMVSSDAEVNKELMEFLVKNDFMLPNISGDITPMSWHYIHSIAEYANKNNKSDDFVRVINNIRDKHNDNHSLVERCEAIIKYRFPEKNEDI